MNNKLIIDGEHMRPKKRIVVNGLNRVDGSPLRYCFDFYVEFNRHGNIEVLIKDTPRHFFSFFSIPVLYVFCGRSGVCISHTPSKRYSYYKVNAELGDSFT